LTMGCGAAKPAVDPPPNGAPEDWKQQVMATFRLLDKNGSGVISLIPYKKRETLFSEISVLGEDVLEKQKEIDDFTNQTVPILEFIEIMKTKIEAKGWEPVKALLTAVDTAAANSNLNECEKTARKVFKMMDSGWADPPNTGSLDFISKCEALSDETDKKAKDLLEGLEKDKKIAVNDWVTQVTGKVEVLGWPRALKQLKAIEARLEKVSDTDDMTAGM